MAVRELHPHELKGEPEWITGAEYNAERRRLIEAGYEYPHSPEFQALMNRMAARNDYLFEQYGKPLMDQYPGKWIAISMSGETILGGESVVVHVEARERFGPGNFSLRRLSDPPGNVWLTPRTAP